MSPGDNDASDAKTYTPPEGNETSGDPTDPSPGRHEASAAGTRLPASKEHTSFDDHSTSSADGARHETSTHRDKSNPKWSLPFNPIAV